MKFWRKKYIFSVIIFALAALYAYKTEFILRPISDKAFIELPQEYSRLTIMPDSIFDTKEILHKSTAVTFLYFFDTNKGGDEIKKYYMEEARKNQWRIVRESNEGFSAIKGDYQLSIGYKNPSLTGRYNIYLFWTATRR